MNSKKLGVALMAVGAFCLICTLFVHFFSTWYEDYKEKLLAEEWERAIRENQFIVEHVSNSGVAGETVDENIDLVDVIDYVDGDQEAEEVVTYKNVLDIPKIEVQAYIGSDTSAYALNRGVGHHIETVGIGEIGNCVVCGHASRTYTRLLNRLEEMELFDQFFAYDAKGNKHTYYITRRFVVEPEQTSILLTTDDDHSVMTIYTCTDGGIRRFVLVGTEYTDEELEAYKEEYYNSRISHMRTLNHDLNVDDIFVLATMRGTHRRAFDIGEVAIRPWGYDYDSVYKDAGVLNFGIVLDKGVTINDVA